MENKMSEVAKLLGVELNEEFGLKNSNFRYKLTTYGLQKRYHLIQEWSDSSMLDDLILERVEIVKKSKSKLDDEEKRYLFNIIKPFKNKVYAIAKYDDGDDNYYIQIMIKQYVYFGYIDYHISKKDQCIKAWNLRKNIL